MRKIVTILGITCLLMTSSCKKFLDLPSQSDYDSSNIFENADRVEMALLGAYTSVFNSELYYQFGMGTDECFSTEGETNSKNQVSNYLYTPATSPSSTYTAMYSGVEQVNVLIKNIPLMQTTSESEKKKLEMLLGESYAIRAKNMLNVVRYFGDAPYPRVPVIDADSFSSSRVSRDTILDGCIDDLQVAIAMLPWKGESGLSVERISKNAAYGLLARTALYAAGYSLRWDLNSYSPGSVKLAKRTDQARIQELYQIARDACKAIVDRGQNTLIDFEDVFRNVVNGKYNNESMLEYGQKGADRNDARIGYTNGFFSHTNSFFGKAQPAMAALPTYYFEFEDGDTRRDVTIATYSINSDSQHQMNTYASNTIGKFRVNWKSEKGIAVNKRDINWIELRYSDVLLMYAESENEINQGPTSAAKEMLEKVRLRAFKDDKSKIGVIPSSYQEFKNAIIQERKLELGFEGWRRTDLIRWGILYEKLTETKQGVTDLAARKGKYADVDLFRAYKKTAANTFNDPLVAQTYISFKNVPTENEVAELMKQGYTLLDMYSKESIFFGNALTPNATWVINLYRGLEKNKVELVPLSTKTIDDNPGLQDQQHPLY